MKKKTKFLSVICALTLTSSMIFSSCGSIVTDEDDDIDIVEDETEKKETNEDTKNSNASTNIADNSTATDVPKETDDVKNEENSDTQQNNKIDPSLLTYADNGYSNGLMLVIPGGLFDSAEKYCIDKNGVIQFVLEKSSEKRYDLQRSFNGKHFLMEEKKIKNGVRVDTVVLCDATGKIIHPEDIGATFIYSYDNSYDAVNFGKMFADGYIFAVNSSSTYLGTVNKMAIFDKNLNKLVDYSEETYKKIYEKGVYFADGYYKVDELYYDLNTLAEYTKEEVLEKINIENKSDFWEWKSDSYKYKAFDTITNSSEAKIDLSQYDTIAYITDFQNGTAGVLFKTDSIYFTIINENGEFIFDPIKTDIVNAPGWGYNGISYENGTYVFYGQIDGENKDVNFKYYVFDKSGLIATKSSNEQKYATISDGAIIIHGSKLGIYNTKLEPLF